MNNVAFFEIQSNNPQAAMRFYGAVFGWTFTKEPNPAVDYWRIDTEGMYGGLLQRPAAIPPLECGTNAFTCSMQVADYDAAAVAIQEHGGQVALEKFAVPGRCWQGYFLDADHNVFGIFQVDESAK